jgi:hypothetical protein
MLLMDSPFSFKGLFLLKTQERDCYFNSPLERGRGGLERWRGVFSAMQTHEHTPPPSLEGNRTDPST